MKFNRIITETDSGKRLDIFLAEQLIETTRSAIAKHLKAGAGKVNGQVASVHRFLKIGDEVEYDDVGAGLSRPPRIVEHGVRNSTGSGRDKPAPTGYVPPLKIIAETDDWLVIDKPAGVLVHPDAKHPTGTLIDALVAHDPAISRLGENPERPGIVHRLDKDVSGLMVIPKTQAAFDHLKQQFAEHSVDKIYLALVHGEMSKDEGDIKFRIARSKTKARMAALPENEEGGRAAWTHYRVLTRFHNATEVELQILSGRTHQIRAHLFALGNPIVGDSLYTLRNPDRKIKGTRLMLQAISLAFTDPSTGERKSFSIPPDPTFEQIKKEFS
jgi:23S rRNA pseudouridine1911/1915/1917 synthase